MQGSKKLRLLCLHGYARNGERGKVREFLWFNRLADKFECVFPDGTQALPEHVVAHMVPEMFRTKEHLEKNFSWYRDVSEDSEIKSITGQGTSFQEYVGIEKSIEVLRDILKEQPFDGIVAHSQGSSMAQMLVARLKHEGALPSSLRFIILMGLPVDQPQARLRMEKWGKVPLPALIMLGDQDKLSKDLDKVRSWLNEFYETSELVLYTGSHWPPGAIDKTAYGHVQTWIEKWK